MPPTKHAVLGASGAHRWMNCPGSVALAEDMPDRSGFAALEGTAAHELAEMALRQDRHPADFLEETITVENDDGQEVEIVVDEEMAGAVAVYTEFVRESTVLVDEGRMVGIIGQLHIERQFSLERLDPPAPMFGTSDAVVWFEPQKLLRVIDLKYGKGVMVEAEGNPQLAYYALGACLALDVVPDTIEVTIVQPRASHPDGPIRTWTLTFQDLVEFKHELFAAAIETQQPNARLVPGDHCKFCRAAPICPAQRDQAIEIAKSEFEAFQPPAATGLSQDELLTVLRAAPQLRDWLSSVEAYAFSLLDSGAQLPGYKLVEKRAIRKWAVEPAELQKRLRKLGLKKADIYADAPLKSPAQIEKMLKKDKVALPEELVIKQSSGLTLAPETDPRPAQLMSAQNEFDAVVDS